VEGRRWGGAGGRIQHGRRALTPLSSMPYVSGSIIVNETHWLAFRGRWVGVANCVGACRQYNGLLLLLAPTSSGAMEEVLKKVVSRTQRSPVCQRPSSNHPTTLSSTTPTMLCYCLFTLAPITLLPCPILSPRPSSAGPSSLQAAVCC